MNGGGPSTHQKHGSIPQQDALVMHSAHCKKSMFIKYMEFYILWFHQYSLIINFMDFVADIINKLNVHSKAISNNKLYC